MQYNGESIIEMLEVGATIKLIGDSITAGGGSSDNNRSGEEIVTIDGITYLRQLGTKCWASLFKSYIEDKYPNSEVINNGCSGITSTEAREYLLTLYSSSDDIIIIMLGTNDRKQIEGMQILYDNLTYIVKYLKKENKKIILMSPNPSTVANDSYKNRLYHQEDVNNVIARVVENESVQFINHFNFMQNYLLYTGKTIDELMFSEHFKCDGLHPTDIVHNLIYRNLVQNLNLGIKVEGATW